MEEIAPAIWNSDVVDLSSPDRITLAGITIDGGVGASIREALASEQARVLAEHGSRAFECSKESAAIHEAGHVVVRVALGGQVRRADIGLHPSGAWIGYTENRNGEWNISPETATVDLWLNISHATFTLVSPRK
jgi:hypothetical protein